MSTKDIQINSIEELKKDLEKKKNELYTKWLENAGGEFILIYNAVNSLIVNDSVCKTDSIIGKVYFDFKSDMKLKTFKINDSTHVGFELMSVRLGTLFELISRINYIISPLYCVFPCIMSSDITFDSSDDEFEVPYSKRITLQVNKRPEKPVPQIMLDYRRCLLINDNKKE